MFVVAHPGHELRAYHLVERVRPVLAVLTDGSGSASTPRIGESRSVIERIGGSPAAVFGSLTDRDAYDALISGRTHRFAQLVDAIAGEVLARGVTAIVIDAAEGYNPIHDVCHWIGRSAIRRAAGHHRAIDAFELDLVGHPAGDGRGVRIALDDGAFMRKLAAIAAYPALAGEAAAAFEQYGRDAFRTEFLRHVEPAPIPPASWVPYYETVGEMRVRSGLYSSVLRYGVHVRPILEALTSSGVHPDEDALRPAHQ
jgi:hypothetical protein